MLYTYRLWALTQQLNTRLDVRQQRKSQYLPGVLYPRHKSNATVYSSTRQDPFSIICCRRQLLWLGHVVREGPNSASYPALEVAINTGTSSGHAPDLFSDGLTVLKSYKAG